MITTLRHYTVWLQSFLKLFDYRTTSAFNKKHETMKRERALNFLAFFFLFQMLGLFEIPKTIDSIIPIYELKMYSLKTFQMLNYSDDIQVFDAFDIYFLRFTGILFCVLLFLTELEQNGRNTVLYE